MSASREITQFLKELSPADLAALPMRVLTAEECESRIAWNLHALFVADATTVCEAAADGEVAIVLNTLAISTGACASGLSIEECLLSAAVHEFAHAIVDGYRPAADFGIDASEARERVAAHMAAEEAPRWPSHIPPFFGHDDDWIRACLHLAFRAEQIGTTFDLSRLMPIHDMGLSPAETYQRMLGRQPARLQALSVRGVLENIPAPSHFQALWQLDLENWIEHATEGMEPEDRDAFAAKACARLGAENPFEGA